MRSILVLDSGMGGLSVCESILKQLPDLRIVYFADDAYFPYGLLEEDVLSARLDTIVQEMLRLHHPELVVLACNTVSTLLLPELREKYDVPFVGVVPAIKPAAQASSAQHIGLLATPATVRRPYTDDLISEFASECEVFKLGSSELVVQAEKYLSGHPVDQQKLTQLLAPLDEAISKKGQAIDVVVLGCTHFPLIQEYIMRALPGKLMLDSGAAIARRVAHLLDQSSTRLNAEAISQKTKLVHQIYFSKMVPNEEVFNDALFRIGIENYQLHCFSASMDLKDI